MSTNANRLTTPATTPINFGQLLGLSGVLKSSRRALGVARMGEFLLL
jgi:hypothetical protein